MMPGYGVDIARSLYETMGNMYSSIGESISRAMGYSLPYIKLKDVQIDSSSPSVETGINVTVLIELPNGSASEVNVNSSTFLPSGEEYGRTE